MNLTGKTEKTVTASAAVLVAVATFVVYLPALHNGFVDWDDGNYVLENVHIRSLNWELLRWAFTAFHSSNWHPLTWISHALDYALWGPDPFGHHLASVIVHSLNACLVVFLAAFLYRMARGRAAHEGGAGHMWPKARVLLVAAVPGLLFGLHPLHVESVAWVSERKDLLCALFYLLSLLAYTRHLAAVRHSDKPRALFSFRHGRYYFLSVASFALALMSKPMAVSLPVVLIIIDWHFGRLDGREERKHATVEKIPLLLLTLASIVLTLLAQSQTIQPKWEYPISDRALVASRSLFLYLWKMVVPVNLSPYYPYPSHGDVSILKYGFFLALIVLVTSAAVIAAARPGRRLWLSAWCYYVVTLLPVLGIVQVGIQSMADRYTYLPSISPFLIVGLGAAWALDLAGRLWKRHLNGAGLIIIALLSLAILSLASSTTRQIKVWEDPETLWSRAIEVEPLGAVIAYLNRGSYYLNHGRNEEALRDFNKGISISVLGGGKGYLPWFYNNRALLYAGMGQPDKALDDIEQALRGDPGNDELYSLRATIYSQKGLYEASLAEYTKAIDIRPTYGYFNNRAIVNATLGRHDEAFSDYAKAIDMDPSLPDAYFNRGNLRARLGRHQEALLDYTKAISLSPGPRADYFRNRAFVLEKLGRPDDARRDRDAASAMRSAEEHPRGSAGGH